MNNPIRFRHLVWFVIAAVVVWLMYIVVMMMFDSIYTNGYVDGVTQAQHTINQVYYAGEGESNPLKDWTK